MVIKFPSELKQGIDLKGGSHFVFNLDMKGVDKGRIDEVVESARNIIERRVNFFGVSEPTVLLVKGNGEYRISVDLPGEKNPQRSAAEIGKTVSLDFREYEIKEIKKEGTASAFTLAAVKTKLTGKYLKRSRLAFDQQDGKPQIGLEFDKTGAKLFAQLTKKNLKRPLGIYIDDQLLTQPIVQQEIKTGEAVISGDFTIEEAKKLVALLNAGALPIPIRLAEQKTIEATLGEKNIQQTIVAGLVGLACVVVFMLLVYKKEGFVAVASLLLYAVYSIGLYKVLGIVLTLSGAAGFILSMGMAVDSNILIYERIQEEKLKQTDDRRAVRVGFFKALSGIREANINTLLVCFVLFNPFNLSFLPQFGMVRGFSLTLAIGVLLSLFTGVFITKNILWRMYKIAN